MPAIAVDDLGSQPYLHELIAAVAAPGVWLSAACGQVGGGVAGLYVADRRAVSVLRLAVSGVEPVAVGARLVDSDRARFDGVVRWVGSAADPTVLVTRSRIARADGGAEEIEVRNHGAAPVDVLVEVALGGDLVTVSEVKSGRPGTPLAPRVEGASLRWDRGGHAVVATGGPVCAFTTSGLRWQIRLAAEEVWRGNVNVHVSAAPAAGFRLVGVERRPAPGLAVRGGDRRLGRLVERSARDLASLLLADPGEPRDLYAAAGAPWYLTLFGRDAIWAARLALPLGTALAGGTARVLARRQGSRVDPATEEAPGKIPHELRAADAAVFLPPAYYGTIDATPLFVSLVAEAWRWGLPRDEVLALIPAVERALAWMPEHGDADRDGFLEYSGASGLSNQGWKDSPGGVCHPDGTNAEPPIALAEVQGYAHAAALDGAALLDAFGRPGGGRWRGWAAGLRDRFRAAFWVNDHIGPYPAIALDGRKRPVASVTSNMGHLLGTGLLDPAEAAIVARRVTSPPLHNGWGVRTLAAGSAGYNPFGYHTGSVWAHDTAIIMLGLMREGLTTEAATLATGLIAAGEAFTYRLPELFAGLDRSQTLTPLPYPASCHPQAWSAAAGIAAVTALLGLRPDLPAGRITLDPAGARAMGALTVTGIAVGTGVLDLTVTESGELRVDAAPGAVSVHIES